MSSHVSRRAPRGGGLSSLPPNALITLRNVALFYGVSYWSVWRAVQAGQLRAARVAVHAGRPEVWTVRAKDARAWRTPVRVGSPAVLDALDPEMLVPLATVATYWDVSYTMIWRAAKSGAIPCERVGARGTTCVRVKDMLAWGGKHE